MRSVGNNTCRRTSSGDPCVSRPSHGCRVLSLFQCPRWEGHVRYEGYWYNDKASQTDTIVPSQTRGENNINMKNGKKEDGEWLTCGWWGVQGRMWRQENPRLGYDLYVSSTCGHPPAGSIPTVLRKMGCIENPQQIKDVGAPNPNEAYRVYFLCGLGTSILIFPKWFNLSQRNRDTSVRRFVEIWSGACTRYRPKFHRKSI